MTVASKVSTVSHQYSFNGFVNVIHEADCGRCINHLNSSAALHAINYCLQLKIDEHSNQVTCVDTAGSKADLDIQVFARPEVHDVDVEVVVGSLRQQLSKGEYLPRHSKHWLIRGCAVNQLRFALQVTDTSLYIVNLQ